MPHSIVVEANEWVSITTHLLKSTVEEAGVLFANVEETNDGVRFVGQEFRAFLPEDFAFQSAYHIELTDKAHSLMIKDAWDRGAVIVEFHSHVGAKSIAEFSPSDLTGFREFVPHVRWRLRARPYAAVVLTRSGFDSLVWSTPSVTADGSAIINAGADVIHPTGLSARRRVVAHVR